MPYTKKINSITMKDAVNIGDIIHVKHNPVNGAAFGAPGIVITKTTNQYVGFATVVPTTGSYTLSFVYYFGTLPSDASKNWQLRWYSAPTDNTTPVSNTDETLACVRPGGNTWYYTQTRTPAFSITANYLFGGYWWPNSNQHDQDMIISDVYLTRTA